MRAAARRTLAAIVAVGVVLVVITAGALGAPAHDVLVLVGWAALGGGVVAGAGIAIGVAVRSRSLGVQVAVLVATASAAILVGALVAAQAMFASVHDLRALSVVLVVATTAGLAAAVVLGDRLGRATEEVGELSSRLAGAADPGREAAGAPGPFDPSDPTDVRALPAELAALREQIAASYAELDAARERERAVEASRRELVAWVSHDLRTPLSGIRAMVEALEDGVVTDPATVDRYHATIRQEADRLAQLVDDLFELSRIQAGALDLDLQRHSLGDLVSDALAGSGAVADARGIALEGALDHPAPEVVASVPELARVLQNLLDNAIRHTPRGGRVRVEARTEGDAAVLVVADSCGGIPEHELDRVFDLAFRGDAARTPGPGGGGFGLAIAQGLVRAHHGEIAVANEPGGCRFTVRLPLPC